MGKKHEIWIDVTILSWASQVCVDEVNRTLYVPMRSIVGIKAWGRIDFLTRYNGWNLVLE
jgi:hypothetical protein